MDGYRRSASSSYPGGVETQSGRSWGSPRAFPRSARLSTVCSSVRPFVSKDHGSISSLPWLLCAAGYWVRCAAMRADAEFDRLETDRLVLRRPRPEDAETISAY